MLCRLIENAPNLVAKEQLIESVWPDVIVGEDSLMQCVREIRLALRDDKQEIVVNLQMLRGRVVLEERVGMSPEAQAFRDARPVLPLNPRPTTTPPERGSSLGQ